MLLTSYFANAKNFPKNRKTVSISRFTPAWFKADIEAKELAPSKELLSLYKEGKVSDVEYTEIYKKETLSKLNPSEIYEKYKDCVLLCYEAQHDFCHRQLVSDWLNENHFKAGELVNQPTSISVFISPSFNDSKALKTILDKLLSNYSKPKILSLDMNPILIKYIEEAKVSFFNLEVQLSDETIIEKADLGICFWDGETENKLFKFFKDQNKLLYCFDFVNRKWIN